MPEPSKANEATRHDGTRDEGAPGRPAGAPAGTGAATGPWDTLTGAVGETPTGPGERAGTEAEESRR